MIFLIAGIKGGVGKSTVSLSLIHYLTVEKGLEPLVIDADNANPDVFKAVHNSADHDGFDRGKVINLSIETSDDWITIIDTIEQLDQGTPVVINTPASGKEPLFEYSQTLDEVLGELKRALVTFWPINDQRDCLELLKAYLSHFPNRKVHVIKNGFYGKEEKFDLFAAAKNLPVIIEQRGGASFWLPPLASRVANRVYSDRQTFNYLLHHLPLGSRAELKRWLNRVNQIFQASIEDADLNLLFSRDKNDLSGLKPESRTDPLEAENPDD